MPTGDAATARAAPAVSPHSLGWGAVTAGVTARSPEGERRLPKSKVRKKSVYTPPEGVLQSRAAQARVAQPSPRWYAPLMVALMVIGLLWIVVYYVAGDRIPFMVTLGPWNFAIGFGAMVGGLVMSMRWR
jgi:cobalamin biosynthesis Mg chelatase CobN